MDRETGEGKLGQDVTVVVGTLDAYAPAWPVFCHGIERYWKDCPWPLAFITDTLEAPCGETFASGKTRSWAERIKRGLRQIRTPIVLWVISDNWLTSPVDTAALVDFAGHIKDGKADHVRVYPGWGMDRSKGPFKHDPRLLIFERKSPYRASLKPALWKVSTFLELLKDGESPWDFERQASRRSRKYRDRFLAVKEWGCFPFVTNADPTYSWAASPISKGQWTVAARQYAEREGLNIDFSKHPVVKDPFGKDRPAYIL